MIVLVAVDALGAAVLVRRADGQRVSILTDGRRVSGVPGQRAPAAEVGIFERVRGFEIGDLLQLSRTCGRCGRLRPHIGDGASDQRQQCNSDARSRSHAMGGATLEVSVQHRSPCPCRSG